MAALWASVPPPPQASMPVSLSIGTHMAIYWAEAAIVNAHEGPGKPSLTRTAAPRRSNPRWQ